MILDKTLLEREVAMHKKISVIALCLLLSGCATQGRDEFYASIDEYLQLSQSCDQPNSFTECTVPLIKRTLEPAWVNYVGNDGIFANFYTRVEEITNQKDSGHIDTLAADMQYKKAGSALLAAIQARDAARVRQQQRIANALAGAAQASAREPTLNRNIHCTSMASGPFINTSCH